jgi:hypothetical protein
LRDINDPEGPGRPITEELVENAVRAGINLKVYAFSSGAPAGNRNFDWEDIALAGNGSRFQLTSDALSMYNDLMSIIDEACLPRDDQVKNLDPYFHSYSLASYSHRYNYMENICL